MTAVEAIAIALPTAVAQGVFSLRRFNNGVDNFSDNPIYGGLNFDIAAGQVLKGTRATADIKSVGDALDGAAETIKNTSLAADVTKDVSTVSKTINAIGKGLKTVLNFTAAYINPVICITSLAKVIFGDEEDKIKAAFQEGISIGTMFLFEKMYKKIFGMPNISYVNGKQVSEKVEGLFRKNQFMSTTVDKFVEKCNTTKLFNKIPMKSLPGILLGLGFTGASISGYKIGHAIAYAGDTTNDAA